MTDFNGKMCLDKQNFGECTRGEDCSVCNNLTKVFENTDINQINFNTNAKGYIPKSKRIENNLEKVSKEKDTQNKLNFNLGAKEYIPKVGANTNSNPSNESMDLKMYQQYLYDANNNENAEEDEDGDDSEEFDMIMKDIINNDALEEIEDDEESDEDKWFPKYKDCECCKGFVYKCKGIACENMNACYCKVKDECDDEEA